ncbi:NUDIX hydrolase [Persicitalea sp.]|uniref:NUDIX hydrolase n=1 Tax=Persicitalea sp. TaxID=3100273 RepID=UPI0035935A56
MPRKALLKMLNNHVPRDENEWAMWLRTIEFVETHPDCFERTLMIGHITASAWVVSPDRSRVLLMHHRKLNRWFQPGGHCDGDPDVLRVAMRETEEETGVKPHPIEKTIFDIDVHSIPSRPSEPSHYHYDIRFLLGANPEAEPVRNAESKEVRWVPIDEVGLYNPSESVLRMQRKTLPSI